MGGGHAHGPAMVSAAQRHRGRLVIALVVSMVVVVGQTIGALLTGSLALLADAGHVLTDAAGVGLALLAVWFAGRPPSPRRSFGYHRAEIFAAVLNAAVLIVVAVLVLIEAVRRLTDPPEVQAGWMLVVAAVGLVANLVGLALLHTGQGESLVVRSAYVEMIGDLLGSAAVIVAAVVIATTGWQVADPIVSGLIGLAILPRTFSLLRDAADVLLEGTPRHIDLEHVRRHILGVPGVRDVHDLHVWTITSGMPVMSAHVVVSDEVLDSRCGGSVLDAVSACLVHHFDVQHCTFQIEPDTHAGHEPALHA